MSQVMVVKAAKPVIKDAQGLTVVDLGFSGSRHGMNDFQKAFLKKLLQNKTGIFEHSRQVMLSTQRRHTTTATRTSPKTATSSLPLPS
jgi:hypothetical protein